MPVAGAILIAVATTFVGFAIDAVRGSELTSAFSVFYFLGCVAAVLAVRSRGLFTTMVQPPLILFAAVPLAYNFFSTGLGGGLKNLILNVAIPLVNRFPLMLITSIAVLIIGGVRMYLGQQVDRTPARAKVRSADPSTARAAARPKATARQQAAVRRTDQPRTAPSPRPQTRPGHAVFRDPAPQSQAPRRPVPPPPPPAPGNPNRRPERVPSTATARVQPPRSVADPYTPAHPIPQVRYRDREDSAQDPARGTY